MLHRTIKLKNANALEVVNPLENTRFVYLNGLPISESERKEVYQLIIDKLSQEDGKYYIVISPVHSDELLQHINGRYPGYSDTLVAKTNLLINSTLEEEKQGEKIDVSYIDAQSSDELLSAISAFQTKCLIEMRPSLPKEAEKKKIEDRYCLDSLKIKANSENIVIFYAKKDNEIIATLTLNSHYLDDDISEKILYASDLILEKNLLQSDFPEKFLRNIFNQIKSDTIIKNIKAVTLMAPGKDSDPLVSCLNSMKNSKLLTQLTTDQQSTIGIIPYFVQNSGASLNQTNYSEVKKNGVSMEVLNLFELYGITVDVVTEKNYTHYIHIHALNASVKLPIDPTDKTLMSSFDSELFDSLKDENNKQKFFQTLSEKLREKIGAKQLIVLSSEEDKLPDYTSPHLSGFDRFRFADPKLLKISKSVDEEGKACQFLEENFYFINSEKALLAKTNEKERFHEIASILEDANFTPLKQNEYKEEELQGKASRFKSDFVTPIVLLNKKTNKIFGMIRALNMGDGFYYLSDEVMNQDTIPLDFFKGDEAIRERFLLGYLMKHTSENLADQVKCFFILAAEGRTEMYDSLGFETFEKPLPEPVSGWKPVMKFTPPGPVLKNMIEKIKSLSFEPTNLQSSASNHGMFFPSRDNEKREEAHSSRYLNLA